MYLRLLFPYLLLLFIVIGYVYYRYYKLGPILLKVDRVLLSRYNNDSLMLIVILAAASYFLMRFDLQNISAVEDVLLLGPYTYVYFYGALMVAVIAREVEKPAIREKGISTPRGFWKWSEVESFRWSKDVLTITIDRGKRKRMEAWQVKADAKKELDQMMKKMVPKRSGKGKKKS
ncbi:MAG: hypothetical protein ACNA7Z_01270 [Dethiobacteria bacterium]|nr:hypothetical protein [Bacillota bacterium]MDW7729052.1 DUF5673 domain-containing protein [Bacillota bacterium]